MAALAQRDLSRLAPQVAFQELRGLLPLPVAGSQLRGFGAPDGAGGQAKGVSIVARPARSSPPRPTARLCFPGPSGASARW